MPYTPDADLTSEPVSSRFAGSAASEFRTLKTRVQQTVRVPEAEGAVPELPPIAERLGRVAAFNPLSGALEPSALTVEALSEAFFPPVDTPSLEVLHESQVATSGQTLFTLTGGNSYTPATGNLRVFVNGLRQYPEDFDETSSTSVTFTVGLNLGDEVLFEIGHTINAALAASAVYYNPLLNYAVGTIGYKLNQGLTVADFKVDPVGGLRTDAEAFVAALAHAHSLVDSSIAWADGGFAAIFPPGLWDLQGMAVQAISKSRIGVAAAGPLGTAAILCDSGFLDFGDYTRTRRIIPGTVENLVLYNTDPVNTDTCVKLYRTIHAEINNCKLINWYIGIDTQRASTTKVDSVRWSIPGRTTTALAFLRAQGLDDSDNPNATPETYAPGGGFRISNVDISGSNTVVDTTYAFLLKSCDGFYLQNSHVVGFERALALEPDGTVPNYIIIDIHYTNCYFDSPSPFAAAPNNVYIGGNVARSLTLADGVTGAQSVYRDIWGDTTQHRAADLGRYCVLTQVTDLNNWATTSSQKLENIKFTGGAMRQAARQAVQVSGAAAGSFVEPRAFTISQVAFDGNNSSGQTGIASDINVSLESGVISQNTFADPGASGADFTISVTCSDAGATDNPNPSVVVTLNDLSKLTFQPSSRYINVTHSETGANVIVADNLLPGTGKQITQTYPGTTTDASSITLFDYAIPDGTGGSMLVAINGTNAAGSKHITYFYRAGFRKTGGVLTLSSGGSTFVLVEGWNPDAFATPPVAEMNAGTLRVVATGIAAQVINWTAKVELNFSR